MSPRIESADKSALALLDSGDRKLNQSVVLARKTRKQLAVLNDKFGGRKP